MWIKSDKWGTMNWGEMDQATGHVGLLPDLSGTIWNRMRRFTSGAACSYALLGPKCHRPCDRLHVG